MLPCAVAKVAGGFRVGHWVDTDYMLNFLK